MGTEDGYKWVALSNVTLGVLLATLDASIVLIAMPDIFRGIHLNPLQPGNSFYLLWMILGFLVVTSVLVVSLGRLGDLFGRVRVYNLGFVIYTVASLCLSVDWLTGRSGATAKARESLSDLTKSQLLTRAKKERVEVTSRMTKSELIDALSSAKKTGRRAS